MNQYVFEFFVILASGRRNVERLCRFTPECVGKVFEVEGERTQYQRVRGGVLRTVAYEAWLRWYSPLCEKGSQ